MDLPRWLRGALALIKLEPFLIAVAGVLFDYSESEYGGGTCSSPQARKKVFGFG